MTTAFNIPEGIKTKIFISQQESVVLFICDILVSSPRSNVTEFYKACCFSFIVNVAIFASENTSTLYNSQ